MSFIFSQSFTEPNSWEIEASKWDYRLLRNTPNYIVEGKGALSILLGETNNHLMQKWGQPYYRDFEFIEKVEYKEEKFNGIFYLYKGRIVEIRYIIIGETPPSFSWNTALGLQQETLYKFKNQDEIIEYILKFYNTPPYLKLKDDLNIYSRGIRFIFSNNLIKEIRIFFPYRLINKEK